MTLPIGTQTVRVFGQFLKPDGSAHKGEIEFRPTIPTYGGGVVVVGPVKARLDATGNFSATLVTTENDVLNPDGWTYHVTEMFSGGAYRAYDIIAPHDVSEVNLEDLVSTAPSAPVQQYATNTQLDALAERLYHYHVQDIADDEWVITHALGYRPNVTVTDTTDDVILADVRYPSLTEVRISFSIPLAGHALLS